MIEEEFLVKSTTPNHGIYFYAIRGEDEQRANSPSWCNLAEAKSVRKLEIFSRRSFTCL